VTATLPVVHDRIRATTFVDSHEHLVEESTRLARAVGSSAWPCDDFAVLVNQYARDDLRSSGMPVSALRRFFSPDVEPAEKWRLVEPHWRHCRHSGYLRAVELTAERLFDHRDWSTDGVERLSERFRANLTPGLYRRVLACAGVECCHVDSREDPLFCDTQQPELLREDLRILFLSTGLDVAMTQQRSGLPAGTLAEWHRILDWAFATYGPRAVAVKSTAAYHRRLNFAAVPTDVAAPLFARHVAGETLSVPERKALEDHLMRECVARAQEYRLPIKLHCGYHAGTGKMPLENVRQNAADLCPLLADFPEARFVLMHIGYPYQDEYIALAKHYPNVWIDLCWAWIVNPGASVRFVKEYLLGAPANKLLTFGGDYTLIELVAGHAEIARRGLGQALSELVEEGWLSVDEALLQVAPLMHGNAHQLFQP
jgi:uncharacterized protein